MLATSGSCPRQLGIACLMQYAGRQDSTDVISGPAPSKQDMYAEGAPKKSSQHGQA